MYKYSERESVNRLLHAMDNIAKDEGDFVVFALSKFLIAVSQHPQKRELIHLTVKFQQTCAETIRLTNDISHRFEVLRRNPNVIPALEVMKEARYLKSVSKELIEIANEIQDLLGFSSVE